MIRDLEPATGPYARARTGVARVVNIPRYVSNLCRYVLFICVCRCHFKLIDCGPSLLAICLWLLYVLTSGVLVHGVVYNKLKVTSHFWSRLSHTFEKKQ